MGPTLAGGSEQAPVRGPPGQLVARGQLELAQHAGHVGLDGLDRDEQLLGDLLVGVATGDQPHHLPLALGEPVEVLVDGGDVDRAGERVEHEPGQPRREHRVPVGDPLDRLDQLRAGDRLGDVAPGAAADRADHVLRGVRDAERQEARRGPGRRGGGQPPHHLDAAPAGQVHVEQHHVGPVLADGGHRLVDVGRLRAHVDDPRPDPGQLRPDPAAEHRVVVDDDDADRCGGRPGLTHLAPPVGPCGAGAGAPRCRRRPWISPRRSRRGGPSGR